MRSGARDLLVKYICNFEAWTSVGEKKGKGFYYVDCLFLSLGNGEGLCDRLLYWWLTRKFHTD